jgi:hypothetical protein
LEKRRGQFNFLTWPFFLAQVFAAEQFFGDAVRPAAAGEEPLRSARSESRGSDFESLPPDPRHRLAGADDAETAAAAVSRASPADDRMQLSKIASAVADRDNGAKENDKDADAGPGSGGGGGGGSAAAPAAEADSIGSTASLVHDSAASELAGPGGSSALFSTADGPITIGDLLTEGVSDLLGDTVGIVGTAAPLVQTPGPALTTASNALVGLTEPVVEAAAPVLGTAADTVGALAGNALDTAATIVQTTNPVLAASSAVGDLAGNVLDTAGPAQTAAIHDAAGPASHVLDTAAPIVDAASPVLAAAAATVGDLASDVLGAAAPIAYAVDPVLATATRAAADPAGDMHGAAAPVAAVAGPLVDTASAAVGDLPVHAVGTATPVFHRTFDATDTATDTIVRTAGDGLGDVAPVAHAALASATDTVGYLTRADRVVIDDVGGGVGLGHGLVDGGAISFGSGPSLALRRDDLSVDGGYSQYAVTMTTDVVGASAHVGHDVDQAVHNVVGPVSNHDQSKPVEPSRAAPVEDKHDASLDTVATSVVGHATSHLDDIGLRGHDGLL